jgi:large subunit ribosomal protein L5
MADDKKSKGAKPAGGGAKAGKPGKPGKAPKGGAAISGPVQAERPRGLKEKPNFAKHYESNVRPALMEKFKYSSVMEAPKFVKIVINMGVGDAISDQKLLDAAVNELAAITGQRPTVRRARKSISNFKLREGQPIGCATTLRGARMY